MADEVTIRGRGGGAKGGEDIEPGQDDEEGEWATDFHILRVVST